VSAKFSDFDPPGLKDFQRSTSADDTRYADDAVRRLQTVVHDAVVSILKTNYGQEKYLIKGVPSDEIFKKAQPRQLEDQRKDEYKDLDVYFDLLDFKDIVSHRQNRDMFKDIFDIPMAGDKGIAFNVRWLETLNALRRVAAHPAGRQYKAEDVSFLRWLDAELTKRTEILV
jgi:hypothetical protein